MSARRLPVARLVAAALVAVITLLLTIVGAAGYVIRRDQEVARLQRLAIVQAHVFAVALELPVWNIDRPQIERQLDSLADAVQLQGVIVEAAGRTHARTRDAQWRWIPSDGRFDTTGLITVAQPIVFNGERIGSLRFYGTMRVIDQDMRRWLLSAVGGILAIDALLILSVYWILLRVVLRPLTDIERYAVDVSAGGSAATPPATSGPTRELESLRSSVETMVRLQESLRRSETMSAMGALVGGVAHEVRNPLFGMTAILDAYRDETSGPELAPLAAGLRQQVNRLTTLMRELLQFGRPVRIEPVPGSIAAVIGDVVDDRGDAARIAQVVLRGAVDPGVPRVAMDRERLCQVFENLVDNAIQHSPSGGTVTVTARPVSIAGRVWVECRVADEGPGFPADDLVRAFEPFFTRRAGGTGLGLSIVQRIVQEHSGTVFAENGLPGAVIVVRLPAWSE